MQQMALAALAIERYRLRVGHVPPSLGALIPEYLTAKPHDFMDAKDLRYQPSADQQTFVLYSVGWNGTDDGGTNMPARQAPPGYWNLWGGLDAVWPQPATPEEARALVDSLNSN